MKSRLHQEQRNAIVEKDHEHSMVTESNNDNLASHYTPMYSDEDLDSVYKSRGFGLGARASLGNAERFKSERLANSVDAESRGQSPQRSGSHELVRSSPNFNKSCQMESGIKGILDTEE